jgi:redox-sensitive bicupin YhaK (pirin superfamily)
VSGPVTESDTATDADLPEPQTAVLEVTESRASQVGDLPVRRALPRRTRRTVGAWCFVDHMGPATVDERGLGVAPHPHIGLQTVTWLLEGEALHRDSLGTEQVIAPGQLNLMTAGHGVAHSEEGTGRYRGGVHGVQLWVAQPSTVRDGPAAFEHHAEVPHVELDHGTATVLVGDFAGAASLARRDSDHAGVDLDLRRGATALPMRRDYEHALVVLTGRVFVDGAAIEPGHLAYLGVGRDELGLTVEHPARVLLVGGLPFDEQVLMWWNFVARTRDEILTAHADWAAAAERFRARRVVASSRRRRPAAVDRQTTERPLTPAAFVGHGSR